MMCAADNNAPHRVIPRLDDCCSCGSNGSSFIGAFIPIIESDDDDDDNDNDDKSVFNRIASLLVGVLWLAIGLIDKAGERGRTAGDGKEFC